MTMDRGMNQVRFQPRRGSNIPVNVPQDFRFPGEPEEGASEQMKSWQRAGEGFSNWLQSEPFGFFKKIPGVSGLMNTLNPFGTAQQRENFNQDIYALGDLLGRSVDNMLYGAGSLFRGGEQAPSPSDIVSSLPTDTGVEQAPASTAPSFDEYLSMYGGQFDASPYENAADYLLKRRQAQLEAVQNMYNQYASEAAANAARVADIYAGAEQGIGETYGGAKSETEAAYQSAQQQAADQMARLGIEDAAAMTMPSQALSQAETLSNLIANQASGESAIQRYGATGRDFASNMAQIAQQQAVEQQDRFTSQLADQLFELEMQRAQAEAAYDPYSQALSRMEAEQAYNEMVNPPVDMGALQDQADFLYQQEQDDANRFQDFYFKYLDDSNYDQLAARAKLLDDIQSGFLGPRLQQWVANNPDLVQQITG